MDVPAAPGALSVTDNFHARRRFLATDLGSVCGRAVELVGIMLQNDLSTFLVELASFLRWSGCFGS